LLLLAALRESHPMIPTRARERAGA
jgi:hypothetical protein